MVVPLCPQVAPDRRRRLARPRLVFGTLALAAVPVVALLLLVQPFEKTSLDYKVASVPEAPAPAADESVKSLRQSSNCSAAACDK